MIELETYHPTVFSRTQALASQLSTTEGRVRLDSHGSEITHRISAPPAYQIRHPEPMTAGGVFFGNVGRLISVLYSCSHPLPKHSRSSSPASCSALLPTMLVASSDDRPSQTAHPQLILPATSTSLSSTVASSPALDPPSRKGSLTKRKRGLDVASDSTDSNAQTMTTRTRDGPKKKKANRACFLCQKAHLTCDDCVYLPHLLFTYFISPFPCERVCRPGHTSLVILVNKTSVVILCSNLV